MVLAAWFKRRQFEKGFEKGLEIGRAESRRAMRKLHNAKLRSLAKEYGIPEDELPLLNESD